MEHRLRPRIRAGQQVQLRPTENSASYIARKFAGGERMYVKAIFRSLNPHEYVRWFVIRLDNGVILPYLFPSDIFVPT